MFKEIAADETSEKEKKIAKQEGGGNRGESARMLLSSTYAGAG